MNTSLRFAVLTGFRLDKTPRIIYQELVQAHGEAICPAERTVERRVCEMKKETFPLVKNKPPGRLLQKRRCCWWPLQPNLPDSP